MELIRLGKCSWYISGWTNVGIYQKTEKDIYLIDTGGSPEEAQEVSEIVEAQGWNILGILVTHAHGDHIGGNRYIQDRYGVPAFCKGPEVAVTNFTDIEPMITYGAHPFDEITHGDWRAPESICYDVTDERFPSEVEVIDIPGHSVCHIGYRLPDNTVFIGDAVVSEKTLKKYPMIYVLDIKRHLKSVSKLKKLKGEIFVPSHASAVYGRYELSILADRNIEVMHEVGDLILSFLDEPKDMESLLKCVFDHYGMNMGYEQYVLTLCILRTFITWFKDDGLVTAEGVDNMFLWRRIDK